MKDFLKMSPLSNLFSEIKDLQKRACIKGLKAVAFSSNAEITQVESSRQDAALKPPS